MRKLIMAVLAAGMLTASSGCVVPAYSSDPVRRTRQLIFTSENLRLINNEWERFWSLDMPAHTTQFRVHGGVV